MGRLLSKAIEAAGLGEYQARALSGTGMTLADIERLRSADLLLVAGLADLVRARFRGDEVRIVPKSRVREPKLVVFDTVPEQPGLTGAEVLREIALLRLRTPGDLAIAVSYDALGLELAQTALLFGADVLFGDLAGKRILPLLEGPSARRREITGLVERSGRRVRYSDEQEPQLAEPRP
jgi:hypothetical protein